MDFKFLHAADIHLDSPLHGLSQYGDVPATLVRTATRDALDNLVARAIEEQVAFVVIAGDLYDGDWEAFSTGLYFCSAMGRLRDAGIEVFLVYGNHDADSHLTRQLPLPDNVTAFASAKPQSVRHAGSGVILHGQSYKTRDPGGDLATAYPPAEPGAFNIGVLHTALNGERGHAPYSPCHPDELAAKGYDYWALGHVHRFDVVRTDPHIVFPGNLQGRNIRETGPKGAALVTVVDGRVLGVEHIALDVVRWSLVEVDLAGVSDIGDAHNRIRLRLAAALESEAEGRPLMARVRLFGETVLHDAILNERDAWREGVRAIAAPLSEALWIEKVIVGTAPVVEAEVLSDDFDELLRSLAADPAVADSVANDLSDFLTKMPAELDHETEVLADARNGRFASVLADATGALRSRLTSGGSR
ncbi:MAG TPA: DNA repair exonuclease [Caulobacteraceae bacterium]|jgi:DNA repair exonuclease SbcCD nuclease subunit